MASLAEPAKAEAPKGVRCERDIVFATTGEDGTELLLDLFVPDEDRAGDSTPESGGRDSLLYGSDQGGVVTASLAKGAPLPVVVFIFGGSWFAGNRYQVQLFEAQDWLVKRGYAVVSCEYRKSPKHVFPAQLHDVKAVVRWVRKNAQVFGLDAERIAAWGPSAGGHLATLLATTGDSGVAALEGNVGGDELAGHSSKIHA